MTIDGAELAEETSLYIGGSGQGFLATWGVSVVARQEVRFFDAAVLVRRRCLISSAASRRR